MPRSLAQLICPTPFAADSGFAAPGMRREPAELSSGEGVLPAPPLPLKPTVGQNIHHSRTTASARYPCTERQYVLASQIYTATILGYNWRISWEKAVLTKSVEIH